MIRIAAVLIVLLVLLVIPVVSVTDTDSIGTDTETLIEITSEQEFKDYIENQTRWYDQLYSSSYREAEDIMYEAAPMPSASMATAGKSVSDGAAEYSTTNVQVTGVDEADYLKNDGKYIYILRDSSLIITDVYPPQSGTVVSETELDGSPAGMFIDGDLLVTFINEYGNRYNYNDEEIAPSSIRGDITRAWIFDISDRAHPERIREITFPGTFENGRMIGEVVYVITRDSMYYSEPVMPAIYEGTDLLIRPSLWCPPVPMNQFNIYTLASFDLTDTRNVQASSFLMGWDNTLYVSADNAYLAYKKWNPYWWNWNWQSGSSSQSDEGQKSVIHRFGLDEGEITYQATGTFPGYLLNQFSLDEFEDNIRVATTNEQYKTDTWVQDNNVYVLSPSLDIIGRLEHLAQGEKIYSARFMGDLLYLVTFKQIDPLFVIDLSNPRQPGILGELKIPGYSDYLHPYDSTHLIGVGKDTEETVSGGVVTTGVKVALFDISDLNNPTVIDSRVIGEKGSTSEVLEDHKAFLLDRNKSIMVLPIKEIVKIPLTDTIFPDSYTTASWQGAYVFGIDPKSGFIDTGRIAQDQMRPNDYYWSGSSVRRSAVMDSVLYTISDNRIIGSDINNPENRLMMLNF